MRSEGFLNPQKDPGISVWLHPLRPQRSKILKNGEWEGQAGVRRGGFLLPGGAHPKQRGEELPQDRWGYAFPAPNSAVF